jgi:hypothetical protein
VFHLFVFKSDECNYGGVIGERRLQKNPISHASAFQKIQPPRFAPKHHGFSIFPFDLHEVFNIKWGPRVAFGHIDLDFPYIGCFATVSAANE